MSNEKTLLLLPGDGIGPEVLEQVVQIIDAMADILPFTLNTKTALFGGTAYDAEGAPISEATLKMASEADVVLMGAVGGPQWANAPRHLRPEAGLLTLRKHMNVFANLRPALCFDALADASALKSDVVRGLDIIFVRELTGGVYFGTPRGIEQQADGQKRGFDTQTYTTSEIERVARVAFELARGRKNHVTSLDKANVMESGVLWREVVSQLHASEYADVMLEHHYADNAAMQLVRDPKQYDVLLTDNLFGDVLSDLAAAITGSIGLLASAALGEAGKPGLFEPIHGSAPDIAGKGLANPIAAILSFEMALRTSLGAPEAANRLRVAVTKTLEQGVRTKDLGGDATTAIMGQKIIKNL